MAGRVTPYLAWVMVTIETLTIEASELAASDAFYEALGLTPRVRVAPSSSRLVGYRGFVLGLVASQPAMVDALAAAALSAGGRTLRAPSRSLWGYGGAVGAPDGTVVSLASSPKKSKGPARSELEHVVLQLGVADVARSRRFYAERGFTVAKSFGRRFAELTTGEVTLTLNPREKLARTMGVDANDAPERGLVIAADVEPFRDPDGFVWERP